MTLVPTHRPHHLALTALVLAVAASSRTAAADTPPTALPPLPGPPGAGPQPGSAPAKAAPGAPVTPGKPVVPPTTPALPPGYGAPGAGVPPGPTWTSPGELPPGYVAPGYYQAPQYPGMQPVPLSDPYALPPLPPRQRKDTGLFVGGVLMVSGGMALALVGSYFVSSAAEAIDIYCDMPSVPCAHKTDAARMTGGALMMTAGALAAVAGIPMWFIGSQYVVVPKDEKKAARQPEVRVGAGSASLSFRF
jgi:hypothetical protein